MKANVLKIVFPIRLSVQQRRKLDELAAYHYRKPTEMLRALIEHNWQLELGSPNEEDNKCQNTRTRYQLEKNRVHRSHDEHDESNSKGIPHHPSYVSHDTASVDSCQPTPLELQQPSLPRLNPITLSELLDGPLEIEWFVDGLIPPGATVILAGDAGVGKTWLTLDLALAVASGTKWLDSIQCKQGTVLIVDEENSEPFLRKRLHSLINGKQLGGGLPIHFLFRKNINLSPEKSYGNHVDSDSFRQLADVVERLKPDLIIFDSLTRCHTANENAANEMSAVFRNVTRLIKINNSSVVFTHHMRKFGGGNKGHRIRGTSDIRAYADSTLIVETQRGRLLVTHDKSRWSEPMEPFLVKTELSNQLSTIKLIGATVSESGKPDIAKWVENSLKDGKLSRQDLVDRAGADGIGSTRKLDDELKLLVMEGTITRTKAGRQVMYSLPKDAPKGKATSNNGTQ